ncbi:MAG TPA: hypothetical protein VFS30_00770 [Dehalococcoidia bacterium]|jgi:hypothetical protein|nr:hypothetical protein [Dehalococcoidia bacterium]
MPAALDRSRITSQEAKRFLGAFMMNREFYRRVPAEKLDYRMVDTKTRRSDSPRESLLHQLFVVRNYVYSVKTGVLQWGEERQVLLMAPALSRWGKQRLLDEMHKTEQELVDLLALADIDERTVKVGWQDEPIPAIRLLHSLNDHEILHTGWNLALMDHLQMERYPALSRLWG